MRIDDPDNLPEYTCHLCKETLRGSEFYIQNRTRKWKTSKGVPKEASYWWMTSRCKDCTRAVQAEISRKNYAPIKEEAKFKKGIKNLFPTSGQVRCKKREYGAHTNTIINENADRVIIKLMEYEEYEVKKTPIWKMEEVMGLKRWEVYKYLNEAIEEMYTVILRSDLPWELVEKLESENIDCNIYTERDDEKV